MPKDCIIWAFPRFPPVQCCVSLFNSLSEDKIVKLSRLKEYEDNKINVIQKINCVWEKVENIAGKGENAGYKNFVLFHSVFKIIYPHYIFPSSLTLCIAIGQSKMSMCNGVFKVIDREFPAKGIINSLPHTDHF